MKEKNRIIFLKSKKVILRPLDPETDLKKVLFWINNREVTQFVGRVFPSNRAEEKEWLEKKRENEIILAIETKKGLFIGTIGLHKIDFRNGLTELGIMIGNKNYWSKGFGFDAEMTLLNYGFNILNLRKIMHSTELRNQRSVGCAQKCGGVKEGILRKHVFKDGEYQNMIIFAIFKNRWQKIWQEYNK